MAEVICDTSPLQYLHQIEELRILPALTGHVVIPLAVVAELAEGRAQGVDLPDLDDLPWVTVRSPVSAAATSLIADLGPGETQVLMRALEAPGAIAVLDDARARRVAETRHIPLTGTLGPLLNAKQAGLIPSVKPCLDRLQALRFRLAMPTWAAVLKLAKELDWEEDPKRPCPPHRDAGHAGTGEDLKPLRSAPSSPQRFTGSMTPPSR